MPVLRLAFFFELNGLAIWQLSYVEISALLGLA